jgi:protein gp37
MSDLFHENIPDEWRDIVFGVIASNPRHTFQILTKRPANMQAYFDTDPKQLIDRWIDSLEKRMNVDGLIHTRNIVISNSSIMVYSILSQILSHVWLGISTENQSTLDQRLPMIKSIYSGIKWLSVEPLLGLIDLKLASYPIDWVVVGGESGTRFRQMNIEWIHSVVKQCNEANIPVYVKQDSCFHPSRQGSIPDWMWKLKQFPHT